MAMGILKRHIWWRLAVTPASSSGWLAAQGYAQNLLTEVENRWVRRFGKATVERLREVLEQFAGDGDEASSLLFQVLKPSLDNWRASTPPLLTLPHFPMVLHRGGYPDGS
jgi:hypothetical protein